MFLCALAMVANARADIVQTRHNLSSVLTPESLRGMSKEEERRLVAREICVFCHTPSRDRVGEAAGDEALTSPKWQRSVDRLFSFNLYDDIGRVGTEGAKEAVGSVSMACLSCHDFSQALGMSGVSDHPFGVPYRGLDEKFVLRAERQLLAEQVDESAGNIATRLAKFIGDTSEFRSVRRGVVNSREIWWASMTDSQQRSKSDLPLYPRKSLVDGESVIPYVECTSCHDPHVDRGLFLRLANQSSVLCQTCHVK